MNKLIFLLLFCFLFSCKKQCQLERIDQHVFDLNSLKETYNLTSGLNEIESLILKGKVDIYRKTAIQSPMNFKACEHFKSYKMEFQNELIDISLRKNHHNTYELVVDFMCGAFFNQIEINPKDLTLNKEYSFKRQKDCDLENSKIESIVLNGFQIKTIKTIDNKVWNITN